MSSKIGKSISESFEFVTNVGAECEALAALMKEEITELFRQGPLALRYELGQWRSSYQNDDKVGWAFSTVAWSLPLSPKDGAETVHLAFQMSFLCGDAAGGGSPEPLLHINCWDVETNVHNGEYMGFPMYYLSTKTLARLNTHGASLFRWAAEEGAFESWTFSLPLAKINDLEAVRNLVVLPAQRLMTDLDKGEELVEQMDEVVCYSALNGQPDYYKVSN